MEKGGLLSASTFEGASQRVGLMERCNQSVCRAVNAGSLCAGTGHRTHQGGGEADRMDEQQHSSSPGTCYDRGSGWSSRMVCSVQAGSADVTQSVCEHIRRVCAVTMLQCPTMCHKYTAFSHLPVKHTHTHTGIHSCTHLLSQSHIFWVSSGQKRLYECNCGAAF